MEGIKEQMTLLLKVIGEGLWEKEHILALGLLSCVAGESIFLLGPPGTAKSMVARRLKEVFKEKKSFEYLMSRFSTPDEIFGPVSISKLKDEDRYERCVDGFLPSATIVFLDEIWKAGPSIQNALLTVINEKIYQNGAQTIRLPMKGLVAASNELPNEDEGLEALWDRFLIRIVSNCIAKEKTFYEMLRQKEGKKVEVPEEWCITDELYEEWQRRMRETEIPDEILHTITYVRQRLKEVSKEENVNPFDYYISDRRWVKIVRLMQASAFLNERIRINRSDLFLLYHTLWNRVECIPTVLEIVTDALWADLAKWLDKVEKELEDCLKNAPISQQPQEGINFKVYHYFYAKLENYPSGNCYIYLSDYKYLHPHKDTEGVMYWDEKQGANLIRRFDMNTLFSTSGIGKNVRKVMLRCSPGCVIIDGQTYSIVKDSHTVMPSKMASPDATNYHQRVEGLLQEIIAIKVDVGNREQEIRNANNLFVSSDDMKLAKKQLNKLVKRCEGVEIKAINALQLG